MTREAFLRLVDRVGLMGAGMAVSVGLAARFGPTAYDLAMYWLLMLVALTVVGVALYARFLDWKWEREG